MTKTEIANLALSHMGNKTLTDVNTDISVDGKAVRKWFDTAATEMLRSHAWNFATRRTKLEVTEFDLNGISIINDNGEINLFGFDNSVMADFLSDGDRIVITGNTDAPEINGDWFITATGITSFTLQGSTYTSDVSLTNGTFNQVPAFRWKYCYHVPSDLIRVIAIDEEQTEFAFENGKILTDRNPIYIKYITNSTDYSKWPNDFINAFSFLLASYIAQPLIGPSGDGLQYREIYEKLIGPMTRIRDSREGRTKLHNLEKHSGLVVSRFNDIF